MKRVRIGSSASVYNVNRCYTPTIDWWRCTAFICPLVLDFALWNFISTHPLKKVPGASPIETLSRSETHWHMTSIYKIVQQEWHAEAWWGAGKEWGEEMVTQPRRNVGKRWVSVPVCVALLWNWRRFCAAWVQHKPDGRRRKGGRRDRNESRRESEGVRRQRGLRHTNRGELETWSDAWWIRMPA